MLIKRGQTENYCSRTVSPSSGDQDVINGLDITNVVWWIWRHVLESVTLVENICFNEILDFDLWEFSYRLHNREFFFLTHISLGFFYLDVSQSHRSKLKYFWISMLKSNKSIFFC
jgi:hypothetical protein